MSPENTLNYRNITLQNLPVSLQTIAEVIGVEHTLMLCRELGGESFYIPKLNLLPWTLKERNQKILKEYNGHNAVNLARKYSLTSRRIYDIIKGTAAGKEARREPIANEL